LKSKQAIKSTDLQHDPPHEPKCGAGFTQLDPAFGGFGSKPHRLSVQPAAIHLKYLTFGAT
jgi:hypothetical protein